MGAQFCGIHGKPTITYYTKEHYPRMYDRPVSAWRLLGSSRYSLYQFREKISLNL